MSVSFYGVTLCQFQVDSSVRTSSKVPLMCDLNLHTGMELNSRSLLRVQYHQVFKYINDTLL
jgi:hypothetical protein